MNEQTNEKKWKRFSKFIHIGEKWHSYTPNHSKMITLNHNLFVHTHAHLGGKIKWQKQHDLNEKYELCLDEG